MPAHACMLTHECTLALNNCYLQSAHVLSTLIQIFLNWLKISLIASFVLPSLSQNIFKSSEIRPHQEGFWFWKH
jgi:hypothetical protein